MDKRWIPAFAGMNGVLVMAAVMKLKILLLIISASLLTGCGFTPLYATTENGGSQGLRNFSLASLKASELMQPTLARDLKFRTARAGEAADYSLILEVKEAAGPLAVQIDASVTRYNYQLRGAYIVIEQATGERLTGTVRAVASFNVVSSQYSTLFAEKAAREKASLSLIEKLERDVLLKLSDKRRKADEAAEKAEGP